MCTRNEDGQRTRFDRKSELSQKRKKEMENNVYRSNCIGIPTYRA